MQLIKKRVYHIIMLTYFHLEFLISEDFFLFFSKPTQLNIFILSQTGHGYWNRDEARPSDVLLQRYLEFNLRPRL